MISRHLVLSPFLMQPKTHIPLMLLGTELSLSAVGTGQTFYRWVVAP